MLHALLDYAHERKLLVEPGFKMKPVRWLIIFSREGDLAGLSDLAGDVKRSKGRDLPCPHLSQPEMIALGAGARHFLVDSLDVVALLTKDGQIHDKLSAKHKFFVDLLHRAGESVPELAIIAASLNNTSLLERLRTELADRKAKPTDACTFAVADSAGEVQTLVESGAWRDWWRSFREELAERRKSKGGATKRKKDTDGDTAMRCLLSGDLVEPQATHDKIAGLSDVGGLAMGDALTSFDKDAFASYGLKQGRNAAVGEAMAATYTAALNDLIKTRSRRMAGAKIVYWYSGDIAENDDVLADFFDGLGWVQEATDHEDDRAFEGQKARQEEARARKLLDAIRSGQRPELSDARFFALTLSANSGRVVVRDWMEGRFEDLAEAIDAWFDDLSIIARDGKRVIRFHKFGAVLAATVRELGDVPGPLVTTLWKAALKRLPIPDQIVAQTLHRVQIDLIQDNPFSHARFGLLKAFCNRNRNERVPNMTNELNCHETKPAYVCGRIMALLAAIQRRAMPDVGVGIVQRYYAAASSTPALVLGRLVRTAQIAHLPKIESDGLRIWFENQLAEVWSQLDQAPPKVLNLEGQTLFAMGYYHQQAQRGAAKSEDDSNTSS